MSASDIYQCENQKKKKKKKLHSLKWHQTVAKKIATSTHHPTQLYKFHSVDFQAPTTVCVWYLMIKRCFPNFNPFSVAVTGCQQSKQLKPLENFYYFDVALQSLLARKQDIDILIHTILKLNNMT